MGIVFKKELRATITTSRVEETTVLMLATTKTNISIDKHLRSVAMKQINAMVAIVGNDLLL